MMIDLDVACNDDATATAPYLCTSPTLISHHENTGVCLTILRVRPTFTSAIVQVGKSLDIDVLDVRSTAWAVLSPLISRATALVECVPPFSATISAPASMMED